MENQNKRTSKAIIAVFVLSLFAIVSFLGGFSYSDTMSLIIGIIVGMLILYLCYYLNKRAEKRGLNGIKLGKFALYVFFIILVLDTTGSLVLINYQTSLKTFAVNLTPQFFTNNFLVLKENATSSFARLISYEKETEDIRKELAEVGSVKECTVGEKDYNEVSYQPYMEADNFKIGLVGRYSIRCYGEKKVFDVFVDAKYENGKWLVGSYSIESNIGKDLIDDKTKKDEGKTDQ